MAETKQKNNKSDLNITPNKLSTDENAVFFELNVNPHLTIRLLFWPQNNLDTAKMSQIQPIRGRIQVTTQVNRKIHTQISLLYDQAAFRADVVKMVTLGF